MALDVQPLSKGRQALMILAMASLLGASLGFAQMLMRRSAPAHQVRVEFPAPPGVKNLPVNDSAETVFRGALMEALADWPQGKRHLLAFHFPNELEEDAKGYLVALLEMILPDPSGRGVTIRDVLLGGVRGIEAERRVGRREDSMFAIIRVAEAGGHIVAFCLSGEGGMTDADRQFFDDYCTQRIQIRVDQRTR